MRCRGVACVSLQGGVALHVQARWVPLCEFLPCFHFPTQVFRCVSGNPEPGSRDRQPSMARDMAKTFAGLVYLHSLNVSDWAAP